MQPLLFEVVPAYPLLWIIAAVLCVTLGVWIGTAAGFAAWRSAVAVALLAASILIGSKLFYLAEARIYPAAAISPAPGSSVS